MMLCESSFNSALMHAMDQATEALLDCKPDKKTDLLFTVDMIEQIVGHQSFPPFVGRSSGSLTLILSSQLVEQLGMDRCDLELRE